MTELDNLKNKIDKAKIVSFDVFDTLLFRMVDRPEAVFEIIQDYCKVSGFSSYRKRAQINKSQRLFKTKGYPHANFDEIYEELGANLISQKDINDIKSKELELERSLLYPNTWMKEVYDYAISQNKTVIITTDMYLDESIIKEFLNNNGFFGFDKIYDSANYRKAKFNKELYEQIIEDYKVNPSDILHIGDNLKDDYNNAKDCGLSVYHYKGSQDIEKSNEGDYITSFNNCIKFRFSDDDLTFFEKFGYYIGGAIYYKLYKFIDYNKLNNSKMFYLSRDGYNLYNLRNDGTYLYASRRSLVLASITDINSDTVKELPPYATGQRISDILNYLCLDNITVEDIQKIGFENFDSRIEEKEDIDKFKQLYFNKSEYILERCDFERKNALNYFKQIGLFESDATIFDCGWHGSSQKLLEDFLYSNGYKHKIKFLYVGILNSEKSINQLESRDYKTCFFDVADSDSMLNEIISSVALFELLFGAPHSSVWYYDTSDIVFEEYETDFTIKEEIYSGISKYLNNHFELLDSIFSECNAINFLRPLYDVIINPTQEEAVQIGNIPSVDGFVKKEGFKEYIAYVTSDMINENENVEVYWNKGLNTRNDITEDVKEFINNRGSVEQIEAAYTPQTKGILGRINNFNRTHGMEVIPYKIKEKINNRNLRGLSDYERWIKFNEIEEPVINFEYNPLISVVVPVYNVKDNELTECIESVLNQTYKNFELILVDDNSTKYNVINILHSYEKNSKISVLYHSINENISQTTNDGIEISRGEFIAFMDCDDILAPNALYEVVKALNNDKTLDFIYSDEDKIDEQGTNRHSPFFKPDWSLDTFLSIMYTSHLGVYRKSIIEEIGGLTVGLEGAQDYDMTLRFVEKTDKIYHIPKILYHWRERPESIASDPEAKEYALDSITKLKKDYLNRNNIKGEIEYDKSVYQYRIVYKTDTRINIIIPTKNNDKSFKDLLDSIVEKCDNLNYLITAVDYGSTDSYKDKYKELQNEYDFEYIEDKALSINSAYNYGAKISKDELLLFMDEDNTVINLESIVRLAGHASLNGIGAVGSKILHKNSMFIKSDGLVNLTIYENRLLSGFDDFDLYYFCNNRMDINYLAVSSMCMMIKSNLFNEIGGFDTNLESYADMDLCMRLYELGYRNVLKNDCAIYNYSVKDSEPKSLTSKIEIENKLRAKHPTLIGVDPFFSNNLNDENNIFLIDNRIKKRKIKRPILIQNVSVDNKQDDIIFAINKLCTDNSEIFIKGFIFNKNCFDNNKNKVEIILQSKDKSYKVKIDKIYNNVFSQMFNIHADLSYFETRFNKKSIKNGEYSVYIRLTNKKYKIHKILDTNIKLDCK